MRSFSEALVTSPLSPSTAACGIEVLTLRPFSPATFAKALSAKEKGASSMPPKYTHAARAKRKDGVATAQIEAGEKCHAATGGRNATDFGVVECTIAGMSSVFIMRALVVRVGQFEP